MRINSSRPRHFAPDPAAPAAKCDMPGCDHSAAYRAPKSRDALREYWWFCLDHVRQYNARWDFYKGMSAEAIEQELRRDAGWQRPTWPLGRLGGGQASTDDLEDAIDGFVHSASAPRSPRLGTPPELRQPLEILGLDWPTDVATAKSRYKSLAKQHHPDANGGDRAAEERLKQINLAYATLRAWLRPEIKVA